MCDKIFTMYWLDYDYLGKNLVFVYLRQRLETEVNYSLGYSNICLQDMAFYKIRLFHNLFYKN